MKSKVILSKRYMEKGVEFLSEKCELVIAEEKYSSLKEAVINNQDVKGLITFLSDKVDREIIDLCPDLKVISNYAVGYNNIDTAYAVSRGIVVTNTPDILTAATADIAMALLLSVARLIVPSDRFMREDRFTGWGYDLMLGKELKGSVIGIAGMGRIGEAMVERALGFGMKVIYYSRTRKPELEAKYNMEYCGFDELVKDSDIISLHLPYSEDVHHLINRERLNSMKEDAILINTARGALIDETALYETLRDQRIFGAGLDVYEFEPAVTEGLKELDNVVLTPHTGSATVSTRTGMAMMTASDVVAVLSGNKPEFYVSEATVLF